MMKDNVMPVAQSADAYGDDVQRIEKLLQYMIDVARRDPFPMFSRAADVAEPVQYRGIGLEDIPRQIKQLMEPDPSHQIRWPRNADYPYVRAELRSLLVDLTCELRHLFSQYVNEDTDSIGCAWPNMGQGHTHVFDSHQPPADTSICTMREFAKGILKGAALLGPERATSLLSDCLDGQLKFRTCILLNGLVIRDSLQPLPSIHIEPLPHSMSRDEHFLSSQTPTSVDDLLSRTMVSMDCTAEPALFKPSEDPDVGSSIHTSFVNDIDAYSISIALALASNEWAQAVTTWHDYGDFRALFMQDYRSSWTSNGTFLMGLPAVWAKSTSWSSESGHMVNAMMRKDYIVDVDCASLQEILEAVSNDKPQKLKIAIDRWMQSKRSDRDPADRFIDLRIALEAMYLPEGNNNELRYRLSLNGAHHLGANGSERDQIFKQLRDTYDAASKVVHATNADVSESDQQTLRDAQDLCRKGILKMLSHGVPNDWTRLVLGADAEGLPH